MKQLALFLLVLTIGCAGGPYKHLREIQVHQYEQTIQAYDDAMRKARVDRISMENQFIDDQADYQLKIKAYKKLSGIKENDIITSKPLKMGEIIEFHLAVEEARKKRLAEIDASYEAFYLEIDKQKIRSEVINKNAMDMEKEIENTKKNVSISGFFAFVFSLIGN